jgi:hypothetical protein
MAENYDKDLCEEVRKNIYACISDLKKEITDIKKNEITDLKKRIAYFNIVGIGILVSIITSLIANLWKG